MAEYVPKHSSYILKNWEISDVHPARQPPQEGGKCVWGEDWQLSNLAFVNTHCPSVAHGREDPRSRGALHTSAASGTKMWLK